MSKSKKGKRVRAEKVHGEIIIPVEGKLYKFMGGVVLVKQWEVQLNQEINPIVQENFFDYEPKPALHNGNMNIFFEFVKPPKITGKEPWFHKK